MHAVLLSICSSLDDLAESITKSHTETRTMNEIWDWNYPSLNRFDLANIARSLSNKIKQNDLDDLTPDFIETLKVIPNRIETYKVKSLRYLLDGNAHQGAAVFMSLMNWIAVLTEPLNSWKVLSDNKALPSNLIRKLRSVQAELDSLVPEKEVIKEQIRLIKEATDAAENLPTDLESLKEARNKVGKLSTDSAEYLYSEGSIPCNLQVCKRL